MANDGIFDIFSVPSLFQKLQHDCQRIKAAPGDRWAAIDFVLTADSLRHWAAQDRSLDVVKSSPIVQVCRDLANRAKHWRNRSFQVKESKAVNSGFQFGAFDSAAFQVGDLVVVLDGEAERQFGPEIGVEVLAQETLNFWRQELGL